VQVCHLENLSSSSLLPLARTTWTITADSAPTASYQRRGSLSWTSTSKAMASTPAGDDPLVRWHGGVQKVPGLCRLWRYLERTLFIARVHHHGHCPEQRDGLGRAGALSAPSRPPPLLLTESKRLKLKPRPHQKGILRRAGDKAQKGATAQCSYD
jgi:hypothetical protein